jgi:hypothetical protein
MMKLRSIPWPRIVTEFLVIFLGVSLSLAGDDWRQRREERTAEHTFFRELMEDLSADSTELSSIQRTMRAWDRAAVDLTRIGAELIEAQDSAILRRLDRLMIFDLYQPVSSAYIGLKESGDLGLVRNPTLRRDVIDYYEIWQPLMLQFAGLVQEAHGRLRLIFQRHTGFVLTDSMQSFWPPVHGSEFSTSWGALYEEEGTRGAMEYVGILGGNWAEIIEGVLEANAELRRSLLEEMGTSDDPRGP